MTRKTRTSLHVVVVADGRTDGELIASGIRPDGQFASFIGTDQAVVVEQARNAISGWAWNFGENQVSRVDGKPYRLLVGKLTGVVKPTREYTVEAL
jgi:hypothetical protein